MADVQEIRDTGALRPAVLQSIGSLGGVIRDQE